MIHKIIIFMVNFLTFYQQMLFRKFTAFRKISSIYRGWLHSLGTARELFFRRLWPLVSRPSGPVKSSLSCFFGQKLWLRAFSHQTFPKSLINQMDHTCIEKNTVSGIRLIGQKYQAKLVLEPAKLLGAWRHCLHASADSRTGRISTTPVLHLHKKCWLQKL